MGFFSDITDKIMRKTNNAKKTRKMRGKSYEEVLKILKEIRKIYEDDDVKEIEGAKKRGKKVLKKVHFTTDQVLLKERGVNDIWKYMGSGLIADRTAEEKIITSEHSKLDDAAYAYAQRHPKLYPAVAEGETWTTFYVKNGKITGRENTVRKNRKTHKTRN
jgi:hypothetical protein